MSEFDIVDLTDSSAGRTDAGALGNVDPNKVVQALAELRNSMSKQFPDDPKLPLKSIVVRLAISVEGNVSFITKGVAEASIEITFGP